MNIPDLIDHWITAEAKALYCAAGGRAERFPNRDAGQREVFLSRARRDIEPQLHAMRGKHDRPLLRRKFLQGAPKVAMDYAVKANRRTNGQA